MILFWYYGSFNFGKVIDNQIVMNLGPFKSNDVRSSGQRQMFTSNLKVTSKIASKLKMTTKLCQTESDVKNVSQKMKITSKCSSEI